MIVVVGLSHRTAPVEVRERFAGEAGAVEIMLGKLRGRAELDEVMFLSTCNRVEVVARPKGNADADRARALKAVREVLAEHGAVSEADLKPVLYEKEGEEAVRHVYRVTSSLDSMVLGEPQILGQVKDAYDAAVAAGTLRSFLARCVHRAFSVAKRVRSETALGAGTVSISSVAVELSKRVFGELNDRVVLLVGAGEMAEAAAKSLGKGAREIRVCNRSFERAATLAQRFGGAAAPLSALEAELATADVVVTSTASQTFVVTRPLVKRVMRARRGRALLFVDIAVPRNVEPDVHRIDNVYVFDIDDLEQQVATGQDARRAEATAAEKIVEQEVLQFLAWARGLDVQPAILALRAKTRGVLVAEVERTLQGRLKHLTEGDRAALMQLVDSATNKLLHAPTTRLRRAAGDGDGQTLAATLQELFELPTMHEVDESDEEKDDAPDDDERAVQ
ncbi:MAG TPA: glutamyl-tRNA reductase [Polyangiaceae bacterium]|jgi:glutamyl-tRNA reductase